MLRFTVYSHFGYGHCVVVQHAADYSSPRSTPLIAFVDTKSGHGMGKPLVKVLLHLLASLLLVHKH